MKKNVKLSKENLFCEGERLGVLCLNRATEKHHLYSDKQQHRKLYGDLIDHDRNIQFLCYNCHHCKSLKKMTEKEFCQKLGIKPRSKTERQKARFTAARGRG